MKNDYFLGLSAEGFHRIAYQEWGQATSGETPIICVHGFSRQSHDFDPLAEYFAKRGAHLFCPDVVGRGESDWLKNPFHYTYEQYAADLNIMIARTGAKTVDWIGTSMGGVLGMFLAAQPKTPIRKLVINDIGAQIPVKGLNRLAKHILRDPNFKTFEIAKKYFQKVYGDFGNLTDEQWDSFTKHSLRETTPGKYATKLDQNVNRRPAKSKIAWNLLTNPHKALQGTLFDVDLWYLWRKISIPVLIIHGKKSDILTLKIIEKMQHIHPKTEVISIDEAGHAPALLDPDEHEKIYDWLAKK